MLPHAHLAFAYIAFSSYAHSAFRRAPGQREALAILVGSQFSDIIDKPLIFLGEPFVSGRTVAHSVLVVFPAIFILTLICRQYIQDGKIAFAFGLSWILQPFVDASIFIIHGTVARDFIEISFLVWPFTIPADNIVQMLSNINYVETAIQQKPVWMAQRVPKKQNLRNWIRTFEILITIIFAIFWYHDGAPGIDLLKSVR
ncbi:metal-dependent hydrolase [Haloarcula sp. NS06]|uniref:metal-dependent hydrolase n=1 Tax=Haloarcula sp. NS06 TaxID=3409688 RepID=UPI003DA7503D